MKILSENEEGRKGRFPSLTFFFPKPPLVLVAKGDRWVSAQGIIVHTLERHRVGEQTEGPLSCLNLCGDRDCLPSVVLGIVSM